MRGPGNVRGMLTLVLLSWAARPASAQEPTVRYAAIYDRLSISEGSRASIGERAAHTVCETAGAQVRCDVADSTTSDEVCRAVAVREGLARREAQRESGSTGTVMIYARCGAGMVVRFEAGPRRGLVTYLDARGNTVQREFPL